MTKRELVNALAARLALPRQRAERVLDCILDSMSEALQRDERIEIRGLGAFEVRVRRARIGRNPKSGSRVDVPTQRWVYFRVGKELRERLSSPNAPDLAIARNGSRG